MAANSKASLKNIDNLVLNITDPEEIQIEIKQPSLLGNVQSKISQYVVNLRLLDENKFSLRVGLSFPDVSNITLEGASAPDQTAFFFEEHIGDFTISDKAGLLLNYFSNNFNADDQEEPQEFRQIRDFQNFIEIVTRNGVEHYNPEFDNIQKFFGTMFKRDLSVFAKDTIYRDVTRQLFSGISSTILSSPLFRFTSGGDRKTSARIPYFSIIDWAPLPNEDEAACGYDPHILSIETMKRRIKEDYEEKINNLDCDDLPKEISQNGTGRNGLSSLEKAIMSGCVLTTLRTYSLDQLLRTMFPLSVFTGDSALSETQIKYIIDKINDELYEYDSEYYESFLEETEVVFSDRMEKGSPFGHIPDVIEKAENLGVKWIYAQKALDEFYEIPEENQQEQPSFQELGLPDITDPLAPQTAEQQEQPVEDPCTDINPPSEIPTTPTRERLKNRVSFLIEEQLYSLVEKLQDLISFDGELSFDEKFLTTSLPLLDIQKYDEEPRFAATSDFQGVLAVALKDQAKDYAEKFDEWKGSKQTILQLIKEKKAFITASESSEDPVENARAKGRFLDLFRESVQRGYANGDRISIPVLSEDELDGEVFSEKIIDQANPENKRQQKYVGITTFTNELELKMEEYAEAENAYFEEDGATNPFVEPKFGMNSYTLLVGDGGQSAAEFDLTMLGTSDSTSGGRGTSTGFVPFWSWFFSGSISTDPTFVKNERVTTIPEYEEFLTGIQETSPVPNARNLESFTGEPVLFFDPSGQEGKVFLEKYIITEEKSQTGQDIFPGERFSAQAPELQPQAPRQSSGDSIVQVLAPREVVNTSNRTQEIPVSGDISGRESLGGEINLAKQEVRNIDNFAGEMKGIEIQGSENFEPSSLVSDKYEKISFGLRLCYVAPLDRFADELPPTYNPFKDSPVDYKNAFSSCQEKNKSYVLKERYQKKYTTQEQVDEISNAVLSTLNEYQSNLNPTEPATVAQLPENVIDSITQNFDPDEAEEKSVFRYVTVVPLMSVESPIELEEGVTFENFFNSIDVGERLQNKTLQDLFSNKYMLNLVNLMKGSSAYEFLFKHSVPSGPILDTISIYSNLVNELPTTFLSKTKRELKNLFQSTLNGGDYTFEPDSEKESGGNRGSYARAEANYGTEGKARDPALFDMAIKTPKLIFKGLTEFIDPVINPASTIVKAANAGKLVPQLMKVLNGDGTPGGVNDKNYFLTEIAFPKGSIPPPLGPIDGDEVVVFDRTTRFGRTVKDEFPTFRLRDAFLRGSEEGNNLLDRYIQNVFMGYKPDLGSMVDYYENADDLVPTSPDSFFTEEKIAFQRFAYGVITRNFTMAGRAVSTQYRKDLKAVRDGLLLELEAKNMLTESLEVEMTQDFFVPFPPSLFKFLREADDSRVCGARDFIIGVLKGEVSVSEQNFPPGIVSGYLKERDPVSTETTLKLDSPAIDWIMWGNLEGSFAVSNTPIPQLIFPGYPLPLPVTPVAMSLLPSDMFGGYFGGPPHTPLGHIYHAIVAAEGIGNNLDVEMKAILREEEGMENKKKLRERLCIDMEQLAAEERRRRGKG